MEEKVMRALNKYTGRSKQETTAQFCSRVIGGMNYKTKDSAAKWREQMRKKADRFWPR